MEGCGNSTHIDLKKGKTIDIDRMAHKETIKDRHTHIKRDRRQATRDKRQETRDKRQETRDKTQDARHKKQDTRHTHTRTRQVHSLHAHEGYFTYRVWGGTA